MNFNDETQRFMRKHRISESDVFDAGQMPRRQWQLEMRKAGKRVAFSTPCKAFGHRLRAPKGACLMCNPHYLAYEKHHRSPGEVYVAFSKATGLVKVGGTAGERAKTLISQSYGGANDWLIVHREPVEEVGNVEAVAQGKLKYFQVLDQVYRGDRREARELFKCSCEVAVKAVQQAAAAYAAGRSSDVNSRGR